MHGGWRMSAFALSAHLAVEKRSIDNPGPDDDLRKQRGCHVLQLVAIFERSWVCKTRFS